MEKHNKQHLEMNCDELILMDREYVITGYPPLEKKIEVLKKNIDDKLSNHDWLENKLKEAQIELTNAKDWAEGVIRKQRAEMEGMNITINTLHNLMDAQIEANKIVNEQKLFWEKAYAEFKNKVIAIYNNEINLKNKGNGEYDDYLITKLEDILK